MTAADLRTLRLAAGLTQPELAARLQVSTQTVWGWEHGRAIPGPARIALRAILGAPVEPPEDRP